VISGKWQDRIDILDQLYPPKWRTSSGDFIYIRNPIEIELGDEIGDKN
jgi:hypothetical protein